MFGFFGRKKDEPSDFNKLRQKQIDEFNAKIPNAKLIDASKSEYELFINTSYGRLPLRITLPLSFPERAPVLHITVRCSHKLLDPSADNLVIHPKLAAWSVHTSLASLLQEIIHSFTELPPQPLTIHGTPASSYIPLNNNAINLSNPPPPSSSSSSSSSSLSSNVSNQSNPNPSPSVSGSVSSSVSSNVGVSIDSVLPNRFDLLDGLTIAELEELVNDTTTFQLFVNDLDDVKNSLAVKDDLYKNIAEQATRNLEKRKELEALNADVIAARKEVENNQAILQQLLSRQSSLVSRYSVQYFIKELEAGVDSAETLSEKLREHYEAEDRGKRNNNEEDAQFVDEYLKSRLVVHERQAKKERLIELYAKR